MHDWRNWRTSNQRSSKRSTSCFQACVYLVFSCTFNLWTVDPCPCPPFLTPSFSSCFLISVPQGNSRIQESACIWKHKRIKLQQSWLLQCSCNIGLRFTEGSSMRPVRARPGSSKKNRKLCIRLRQLSPVSLFQSRDGRGFHGKCWSTAPLPGFDVQGEWSRCIKQ